MKPCKKIALSMVIFAFFISFTVQDSFSYVPAWLDCWNPGGVGGEGCTYLEWGYYESWEYCILGVYHVYQGDPIQGQQNRWCWAACSKMILDAWDQCWDTDFYGYCSRDYPIGCRYLDVLDLADWAVGGANQGICLYNYTGCTTPAFPKVDNVLECFGDLDSSGYGNYLSFSGCETQIQNGRPFIIQWHMPNTGNKHVLVVDSYYWNIGLYFAEEAYELRVQDPCQDDCTFWADYSWVRHSSTTASMLCDDGNTRQIPPHTWQRTLKNIFPNP